MKSVPLARRVRELVRGRRVEKHGNAHQARWLTLGIVFVLTVLLTSPYIWERPVTPEMIDRPVIARAAFRYQPPDAQERWEERRRLEHDRVFSYDPTVRQQATRRLETILDAASSTDPNATPETWRNELARIDAQIANWDLEKVRQVVLLSRDERFQIGARSIIARLYDDFFVSPDKVRFEGHRAVARIRSLDGRPIDVAGGGIESGRVLDYRPGRELDEVSRELRDRLRQLLSNLDGEQRSFGAGALELLTMAVKPSLVYDDVETARAFQTFPKGDLTVAFKKGDLLVPRPRPGDPRGVMVEYPYAPDEAERAILAAYAVSSHRLLQSKFFAQVLFVATTFLIIAFFVKKFRREVEFSSQTVLLLSLPVLLALGLGRVFLVLAGEGSGGMQLAGFAFPAGVIGILGILLLEVRLALLLVTWGCILFGLEANLDYQFVIVGLFGGYTAVAALYTFRERREVLYAGLLIGVVNAATILIIKFIGDSTEDMWAAALVGALSGTMCSLISIAVLPVFEVAFAITTDMRLLELSGLEHPLLRKLEETAPGTWQHTLNVTKLAESAASAIGVNYLLVRTGCLFHDVGKMSKPEYFTENQLTTEDKRRHAELKPQMSTLIIRNHVKEGLELAKRHNLPKVIQAFIPEHHGTSLIQYFYHKALASYEKGETKEPVREEDYRYPGPKPQSIESAIVMLADTVEATATAKLSGRSVRDDEIQMLVRNAIFEKFNDGQFDNCNLTMRDLDTVRESFVKTLRSRFHTRIDYPTARKDQSRRDRDRDQRDSRATRDPDRPVDPREARERERIASPAPAG